MAGTLFDFYQKGWKYLETSLLGIVGRSSEYAVEEGLFRKHVIDAGWNALPEQPRRLGRQQLRWDEILLALRREVYHVKAGKLVLRSDCARNIAAVLRQMLQANAKSNRLQAVPSPAAAPAATPRPIPADTDDESASDELILSLLTSAPAPATAPKQSAPAVSAPAATTAPPTPPTIALGIDFGTTYSTVAYLDARGRPITIPNAAGEMLTPSVVLFETAGVIAGKEALAAAALQPDKVAEAVKRDMGAKNYHRPLHGWDLPPEAIAAFILRSLKTDAERKLGPVNKAVITVPAYFDEKRRQATMVAGKLVEFEVLDVLNEPIAAALAWGYQQGILDRQGHGHTNRPIRVVVYDLGGGTFDVTVVEIAGNSFKMLATDGDVYLGGKDWDEMLADMAAERIVREIGQDPRRNPATLHGLNQSAEAAKRILTDHRRAAIAVNLGGKRHRVEVSRQEFENATAPLLARTRTLTASVVLQAGLDWRHIDKVLLVGGATRMPMVARLLEELTGVPPDRSISPDEAVAHGAALYADLLLRRQAGAGQGRFSVTNVNAHSLGIVGVDGKTGKRRNQILIPRNTPLPCMVSTTFKTSKAKQRRITIRVVQGESADLAECTPVGFYTISDLPPDLPAGWPVQLTYTYQENGEIQVQAKVEGHNTVVRTTFKRENSISKAALKSWNKLVKREWKKRAKE
jgi:molecular chaperone DnaK